MNNHSGTDEGDSSNPTPNNNINNNNAHNPTMTSDATVSGSANQADYLPGYGSISDLSLEALEEILRSAWFQNADTLLQGLNLEDQSQVGNNADTINMNIASDSTPTNDSNELVLYDVDHALNQASLDRTNLQDLFEFDINTVGNTPFNFDTDSVGNTPFNFDIEPVGNSGFGIDQESGIAPTTQPLAGRQNDSYANVPGTVSDQELLDLCNAMAGSANNLDIGTAQDSSFGTVQDFNFGTAQDFSFGTGEDFNFTSTPLDLGNVRFTNEEAQAALANIDNQQLTGLGGVQIPQNDLLGLAPTSHQSQPQWMPSQSLPNGMTLPQVPAFDDQDASPMEYPWNNASKKRKYGPSVYLETENKRQALAAQGLNPYTTTAFGHDIDMGKCGVKSALLPKKNADLTKCTVQLCSCPKATLAPRPMNAFILFRTHYNNKFQKRKKEKSASGANVHHMMVSKKASTAWNKADARTKAKYRNLAAQHKQKHEAAHPGYKYEPGAKAKQDFGNEKCKCGAYMNNMAALRRYQSQSEEEDDDSDDFDFDLDSPTDSAGSVNAGAEQDIEPVQDDEPEQDDDEPEQVTEPEQVAEPEPEPVVEASQPLRRSSRSNAGVSKKYGKSKQVTQALQPPSRSSKKNADASQNREPKKVAKSSQQQPRRSTRGSSRVNYAE